MNSERCDPFWHDNGGSNASDTTQTPPIRVSKSLNGVRHCKMRCSAAAPRFLRSRHVGLPTHTPPSCKSWRIPPVVRPNWYHFICKFRLFVTAAGLRVGTQAGLPFLNRRCFHPAVPQPAYSARCACLKLAARRLLTASLLPATSCTCPPDTQPVSLHGRRRGGDLLAGLGHRTPTSNHSAVVVERSSRGQPRLPRWRYVTRCAYGWHACLPLQQRRWHRVRTAALRTCARK